MKAIPRFFLICSAWLIVSCSNPKQNQQDQLDRKSLAERPINPENNTYQVMMEDIDSTQFYQHYQTRIESPTLNLNQSFEGKSISDLGLLKNTLFAMKGKLFQDALYYAYFDTIPWYQPPFWDVNFSIKFNEDEQWFINRIDNKVSELQEYNYTTSDIPNLNNAANAFQWNTLMNSEKLKNQGFFMTPANNDQLFEIYEQNIEDNIPSFVTTDLIMHQMHLFYGSLENEIEEKYLTNKLKTMLEIINVELYASYEKTLDPKIEQAIEESLLYYSIPYAVITGKKTNLIGRYNELYVDELTKVLSGNGLGSKIMSDDQFDYAIFKPRGHYLKNNAIKKYYKSLTWLQKIKLCLNNENDFNKALIVAFIIHKNEKLKNEYRSYIELKTYFSSQKNQFTLWDLAEIISLNDKIKLFDDLFKPETIAQIKKKLGIIEQENCQLTVSLMPIEYQNLFTDLGVITDKKQSPPLTIDLFAALGNPAALEIFNQANESNESYLISITENLINISSQEDARSMDWLSTLLTSFNTNNQNHIINPSWKKKELNTALASWIQLNQRVFLTSKSVKKEAKDSTDTKISKGYVEPNVNFWNAAITLLENTNTFLSDRNMLSSRSAENVQKLMDLILFLDDISEKELSGKPISNDEFIRINSIGDECHTLALQLINPKLNADTRKLTGSMAYAANVYHGKGNKNLIGGLGNPNILMALAEINGYIYLTRGATYSYYELHDYNRQSINQRQWLQGIANGLQPVEWAQSLYSSKSVEAINIVAKGI